MVLCLLCVAGAWLFWRLENRLAEKSAAPDHFSYTAPRPVLPGQLPAASQPVPARVRAALATNKFALRLSNTAKSIGELVNDRHAILLENALIDTGSPLNFSIPKHLQSPGDPGTYIVQARGPVSAAFRGLLARAGAEIISYIPNDAYLVKVSAGGAGALADSPLTQSVIPYEPYYKIQSSLLNLAVGQKPLPDGAVLNLGLFAASAPQTIAEIEQLGGRVLARDASPFGPVVRVQPPADWTALAALPGVQIVEAFHPRVHANDLSRVNTGVSVDTLVSSNYMNLSGSNVMVAVADSGIDATHPGFTTGGSLGAPGGAPIRVFGLTTNDLVDTDGHGTFVAGEIAGNGDMSTSPVNVGGILQSNNYGSVSNADFRGKAPLATLFAMNMNNSDQSLQEDAALTNALILNSSWNYDGDNTYNLAAVSYDAATRDALPGVTGSQPVLFVFSAGNAGYGDDSNDPGGGNRDTIQSPATAKDVLTAGAIQEQRDITNLVRMANGTTNPVWLAGTSTGYRVASYSSRGNVGIGIEGTYGRFKPDVVAPGTFIVSTRSSEWDTNTYFYDNPTNTDTATYDGVIADPDSLWVNGFPIVPNNAIGVSITVTANADSPNPFPTNLPIYFSLLGSPFPGSVFTANDQVNIPADGGLGIADILNSETLYGFNYGISNITSEPISFDLTTTIITTNGVGENKLKLHDLDDSLKPYYRFETGTSMAAADVSGVLALMQDFFTNTLRATPSPALLKAMLINGARPTGLYNLQVNNSINFVGWGLVNLPNSLPTNNPASFNGTTPSAIYFQDQSPTNALATGDSHTFLVTVQTNTPELRVTLVWTDPPGNPAAAIKLVNHLELVVTNMDNPTNPVVYYGNDIPAGYLFNTPENPTNLVVPDSINNVQNVIIPPFLGTNYAITVIGRDVNVNADSAQTNSYNNANPSGVFAPNVVQDYALVVSSVDGGMPGAFTVTDKGIVSNPTGDQDITFVTSTNQPYLNQFAGASSPLPGTNTVAIGADTVWGANGQVVLGETNQWHFYVVTNNGVVNSNGIIVAAPYAGFVTFLPPTLAVPRMGVFADTTANATRSQSDIDLYVTTDPTLTNLNPAAVASCLNGTVAPGSVFNGVSLSRGGTEYVVDTNSTPGEVYYIGVKSEDQMAAEYDFFPVFSNIPFSTLDANGDETVNGVPVPVNIPDGTPANPGVNFVMGLAIYPINVGDITVTNEFTHQNFGDLYGTLTHDQSATGVETVDVLNNHDGWKSVTNQVFVYNETYIPSGTPPNTIFGPSDGPGSLESFFGQDGSGVWRLTEADDSLTQTGSVQNFTMFIRRHQPLTSSVTNAIPPHSMIYDFVDVPAGATNLTINATNITVSPDMANPLLMVLKFGSEPTLTDADKGPVALTNGIAVGSVVNGVVGAGLGNSLSVGPTDVPPIQPGRYWVGVTNQSDTMQTNTLIAVILPPNPVGTTADFAATGSTPLLDDAVTNADIFITNTMPVVSVNVGIRVDDPRISDLVFHLISPDGTRVLLMENRGGATTNGAGATYFTTNSVNATANGTAQPNTNYLNVGETAGTLAITYNFYTVPDEMTIYYGTNTDPANVIYDTGVINNQPASGPPSATNTIPITFSLNFGPTNGIVSTYLTIVMDQFLSTNRSDAWIYTAGGVSTNYAYLTFTEDTNLTTTPIKYAVPPFVPAITTPTNIFTNSFEGLTASDYAAGKTVAGWAVLSNQVSLVSDSPNAYDGSNYLALASGTIFTNLPTVAGRTYTLTFAYRGPGIAAWWRAETNTSDSINGNNPTAVQGITFTNGEVGQAFHYAGSTSLFVVPASPSLVVSNLTLESWVFPTDNGTPRPIFDWGGPGEGSAVQLWINTIGFTSVYPGAIHAVIHGGAEVDCSSPVVTVNQWNHVVFTMNIATRTEVLYCNGVQVASGTAPSPINVQSYADVDIGYRDVASTEILNGSRFLGNLDEVSVYNRPLCTSEIKAIYNLGINGKYDPVLFNTSPAQSLAEAQVSLNGQTQGTLFGNNTNWQIETITFTATQNGTPLAITGLEPGMLLDGFTLTQVPGNLYYLPEQSLDAFTGESAFGDWQLEIQDDRAGAGLTNSLVSWNLQFVFANTNAIPAVVSGGVAQTNFIPVDEIAWYQITVPADATMATNILRYATAPVNVWFSTNAPPTITNPGDVDLIPNSTGNIGNLTPATLSTNTASWPYIVSGGTYYLGVQNTNSSTVSYAIKVNFNGSTNEYSVPLLVSGITASGGGTTLKWTASPGAQFQVQWTDDLTQPWNTDPVVIKSDDGNFTFTDDGSQTAPLGTMRFYRLVQISP